MSEKKDQRKVGAPVKPRGQEMGRPGYVDQNVESKKETPALRGRRKQKNEMFGDSSSQHVGGDSVTPSTNAPSVPAAIPTGVKVGETGGEKAFKRRQAKNRQSKT